MPTTVVINGVTYDSVPRIRIPRPSGNYRAFWDCSNANARPEDVAAGKYFYTYDGYWVGTKEDVDLSNANAQPEDVTLGKIFYNADGYQEGARPAGGDIFQDFLNQSYRADNFHIDMVEDSDNSTHTCYGLNRAWWLTLPNTITSISDWAFNSQNTLHSVTGNGVTSIGVNAFRLCENLSSATFPAVQNVGMYAFMNCYSLSTLHFPVLAEITEGMLQGCCELEDLYLGNSSVVTFDDTGAGNPLSTGGSVINVHVPANLLSAYQSDNDWQAVVQMCSDEGITLNLVGDYE